MHFSKMIFFKSTLQICKYYQSIAVSVHNNNIILTINLCIEFSVEIAVFLYCRFSDNIILNYKV